ncbi:MAG: TetR/AcrR family transcriptional regulator [Pikeienuella sp.]
MANKPRESDLTEAKVDTIRNSDLVERRRGQILDAALKLFLAKGYASTTIRDICAASGVNQASLYDYIANRKDILRRLLNRVWFRPQNRFVGDQLLEDPSQDLAATLRTHFREQWTANREGIQLAYRTVPHLDAEDRALLREREDQQTASLAKYLCRNAGLPEDDDKAKVIANLIIYLNSFGPMRDWLTRDVDLETALDATVDAVIAMVGTLKRD